MEFNVHARAGGRGAGDVAGAGANLEGLFGHLSEL